MPSKIAPNWLVTLNIRPDVEDVGRDGIGGGIEEEDDEIVDTDDEDCGGVSTPTRFDQYFRLCLKKSKYKSNYKLHFNIFSKGDHTVPVKNDEGGHHGDVQHENDDNDDDERAVRTADVGRVAVVSAAVFGRREVCVARRLRVRRAFGEVTRTLKNNRFIQPRYRIASPRRLSFSSRFTGL